MNLGKSWSPVLLCLGMGCLPEDGRPEPGEVRVTFTGRVPFATTGFETSDGWTMNFSKILVSLASPELEEVGSSTCTIYSEASYGRIFDGLRTEPEKVALLFGLGECGFGYYLQGPDEDEVVLSPGTTEHDLERMRELDQNYFGRVEPMSLLVEGWAQRELAVKQFQFEIRVAKYFYGCRSLEAGSLPPLQLNSRSSVEVPLWLSVETLFKCGALETCFAPFATADDEFGNGDGVVTFEDLALDPSSATPNGTLPLTRLSYLDQLMNNVIQFGELGICNVAPASDQYRD